MLERARLHPEEYVIVHRDDLAKLKAELATEREKSERVRRAFLRAEGELEDWCPQQDQTMDSYLRRWGLQADDLGEDQPKDGGQ